MSRHLAIDLGASSGRLILGTLENGSLELETLHRFDNLQRQVDGHVCWDLDHLWTQILSGLALCPSLGKVPDTIGVDTWGVDYVLLDKDQQRIGEAIAYRDPRTAPIGEQRERFIASDEHYRRTGIPYQVFNTIYQLIADQTQGDRLDRAKTLLMTPDYFHFLLTGQVAQEATIASTTGLVDVHTRDWDLELIERLGLPTGLFLPLSPPGTVLGSLRPELVTQLGFDATVILPPSHDTASAFTAVPLGEAPSVILSSGTWSLLGIEATEPLVTPASMEANFSNEGGYQGRYRILKNIMGLWLNQSVRRELNGEHYVLGADAPRRHEASRRYSFVDLAEAAEAAGDCPARIDVHHERYLAPASMIEAIKQDCLEQGAPVPTSVGELMHVVYESLAEGYRGAIWEIEAMTGQTYSTLHIVGGGCQDDYLNRRTAAVTGKTVLAGPVECTAIGNIVVQAISAGTVGTWEDARALVAQSMELRRYS